MTNQLKNEYFWKTESTLFQKLDADNDQWAMWLDLNQCNHVLPTEVELSLQPVSTKEQWQLKLHRS